MKTQPASRRRAHSLWISIVVAMATCLVSSLAFAGAPVEVPVQGLLTESDGTPVDGTRQVTFRIYPGGSGSTAVWESQVSVDVDQGLFEAHLGADSELDSDIFHANPRAQLTITIEGDDESPRMQLGAVPTAAHAVTATTADDAQTLQGMTPDDLGAATAADVDFDDTQTQLGANDTQAALEALMQRIEALEQDNQDLEGRVASLEAIDVQDLDNRVSSTETEVSSLDTRLSSAEGDISGNSSSISSLQSDVSSNSSSISSLQNNVSSNSSSISSNSSSISSNASAISSLQNSVNTNTNDISSLQSSVGSHSSSISSLQTKTASMSATSIGGRSAVTFDGVNLYVRNGTGSTDGTPNGTGNLIVGYDEAHTTSSDKSGSHNVVYGRQNNYTAYGGLVGGYRNELLANDAIILTGSNNEASGVRAAVIAGTSNTSSGSGSVVITGSSNEANYTTSTIINGFQNVSSGYRSVVVAGGGNVASGWYSAILGGADNEATGSESTVGGGSQVINSSTEKFAAEGTISP